MGELWARRVPSTGFGGRGAGGAPAVPSTVCAQSLEGSAGLGCTLVLQPDRQALPHLTLMWPRLRVPPKMSLGHIPAATCIFSACQTEMTSFPGTSKYCPQVPGAPAVAILRVMTTRRRETTFPGNSQ